MQEMSLDRGRAESLMVKGAYGRSAGTGEAINCLPGAVLLKPATDLTGRYYGTFLRLPTSFLVDLTHLHGGIV